MNRQIRLGGKLIRMKKFGQEDDVDEVDAGIGKDNQEQQDDRRPIRQMKNLRIENIPRNVSSVQLKEAFKQFGEVECTIAYDHSSRTSLGFGFADFTTPAKSLTARNDMNGRNIFGEGRAIRIIFARTSDEEKAKLHISQLPPSITPHKFRQLFEKQQQQIQMGQFAFIVLNFIKEQQKDIREMNNVDLEGWRKKVDRIKLKEEVELQSMK
ncbi:MAG: hypothetical protein EZS28_025603 [Streblomastix strix]|uniref:RRM domain-containing protein n=1 Tax=Streblomastix strix TaxID=222440 RepID=A0A5J4V8P2_9EUKA|nr:MAG: hypothetical protein EZS28_025603 [Streblomastix strix]